MGSLERDMAELRFKIDGLEKEKTNLSSDRRDSEDRVTMLREQIDDEERNVDRLEKANKKAQMELLEVKEAASGGAEEEKDTELRMERECKRLKSKLDESMDKQAYLANEKKRIESTIEEQRSENRSIEDRVSALQEQLAKQEAAKKELESKLDSFLGQFRS